MRREDKKQFDEWEEIRRDSSELAEHGVLKKFCSWIVKVAEDNQKEILDQIRKRDRSK